MCVAWLVHMWDLTPSLLRYDWPLRCCGITPSYVWHVIFICVVWLCATCGMTPSLFCYNTPSCVWHDSTYVWVYSFIIMTRLLRYQRRPPSYICNNVPSCVWTTAYVWQCSLIIVALIIRLSWHASFIYITAILHICGMTPSHVWHDSFIIAAWPLHSCSMLPS